MDNFVALLQARGGIQVTKRWNSTSWMALVISTESENLDTLKTIPGVADVWHNGTVHTTDEGEE